MRGTATGQHNQLGRHERQSMLTPESRVAGGAVDEGGKDCANADTSTRQTNGGETGTLHLASSEDGGSGSLGDNTARLGGRAHHDRGEGIAALAEEETVTAGNGRRAEDGARETRSWRTRERSSC